MIPPYATIGRKLGHSYSKLIHRAFGKYDFELIELEPDEAANFIRTAPYKGITVTIPYKKLALQMADVVSPEARRIGCANTLVREPDGKLHAYNTDYDGFKYMTANAGVHFRNKKVLILGSGGTYLTSRTVACDEGARDIVNVSRSGAVNYQNVMTFHNNADIIINTTPVGMFPNIEESPLDLAPFSPEACVDVVYNPMRTRFKQLARKRDIIITDGLQMLVAQAKFCMDHFLNKTQPDSIVRSVVSMVRRLTANIVLIGMPGAGKSTIARIISQQTSKKYVSIDDLITERAQKTIPQIFADQGEDAFRKLERQVISDVAKQSNLVIDTGGGAILDPQNRLNLSANGFVYYVQRDLDKLELNAGRPLSTSRERLEHMFREREQCYRQAADHPVANCTTPFNAAQAIIGAFNEDSRH